MPLEFADYRLVEPLWLLLLAVPIALRGLRQPVGWAYPRLDRLHSARLLTPRRIGHHLGGVCRAVLLVVLAVVLAQPERRLVTVADAPPRIHGQYLFVSDISGSMAASSDPNDPASVPRLQRLQQAAQRILSDAQGGGRFGLITFARAPRLVVPMTASHAAVRQALDRLQVDPTDSRTDLGAALALALDRLLAAADNDATLPAQDTQPTGRGEPRAVILLTDGAQTIAASDAVAGVTPGTAARLAESLGVPIHVIDLAAGLGSAPLARAASLTGGSYQVARDGAVATADIFVAASAAASRPLARWHSDYRRWLVAALVLLMAEFSLSLLFPVLGPRQALAQMNRAELPVFSE